MDPARASDPQRLPEAVVLVFGTPRALAAAVTRAHMTSSIELLDENMKHVWTGPASIQSQSTRVAVLGADADQIRVTMQDMNVYMPPDAPVDGYTSVLILAATDHELVGVKLVVTGKPIDTEAPYRRAIVERSV